MAEDAGTSPTVHVLGAGLIGTSVGLGLRAEGWAVTIEDADPQAERIARSLGAGGALDAAGRGADGRQPGVVVVATPPAATALAVGGALRRWPEAVVTDVASVKSPVAAAAEETGHGDRYVGSHPMAGREVSGGLAAQGDLFRARPWVLCPNGAGEGAVAAVRSLAQALGADVVVMGAAEHDAAVARVSHAPQVAASAVAAALGPLRGEDVALAGQGLRDVTRIAASDSRMWGEIAALNAEPLRRAVADIVDDLRGLLESEDLGAAVQALVARGREQVARVPGKHGGERRSWSSLTVLVPDEPGALLRLLAAVAERGVNIEDLAIEHSPRQPVGLVRLSVEPAAASGLGAALESAGWEVVA